MRKLSTLLVPGLVAMTLAAGPALTSAYAAGSDEPSSPPKSDTSTKKGKKKSSSVSDPKFLAAYRTAYTTIYDNHDYAGAIGQLKSLKRDDVADVANLIGYSYRKIGDYQSSKIYYELALKDDPNHVRTWQYYGLLAARAGQPGAGAVSLEQDRLARRHRQLRVSLACHGARQADRRDPRLLKTPHLRMKQMGTTAGLCPFCVLG
ncbi:tetratricopeptide (TPR) repeat protein [Bradyrhizobium sp. LM2.9]